MALLKTVGTGAYRRGNDIWDLLKSKKALARPKLWLSRRIMVPA